MNDGLMEDMQEVLSKSSESATKPDVFRYILFSEI